jgi:Zn-dependent protease with chaperone function
MLFPLIFFWFRETYYYDYWITNIYIRLGETLVLMIIIVGLYLCAHFWSNFSSFSIFGSLLKSHLGLYLVYFCFLFTKIIFYWSVSCFYSLSSLTYSCIALSIEQHQLSKNINQSGVKSNAFSSNNSFELYSNSV